MWRLIIHDYGKADNGSANLKPALDVLYSLALIQGVWFVYMNAFALQRSGLVARVRNYYNLQHTDQLVPDYTDATVAGCKKGRSSFTDGRNLVTYAVDMLIESKSPESYIKVIRDIREMLKASLGTKREAMVQQLLTDSASFSHIVRKLLRIMHPRSRCRRETREHAAGILMFLAEEVHLEQFPGGIQSISSLLDPSEEYTQLPEGYHRDCFIGLAEVFDQGDWFLEIRQQYEIDKKYKQGSQEETGPFMDLLSVCTKKFVDGLCILWRLADDMGNCRVISNTEGLMSRITAPLISSRLHQDHHEEWTRIAKETLPLLCRFMATPGEIGVKLRCQISSNGEATIKALRSILECDTCNAKKELQSISIEIYLDLFVNASSIMAYTRRSTETIILTLLRIFLVGHNPNELKLFQKLYSSVHWMKKRTYIRNLASEELVRLSSQSKTTAMAILRADDGSTPAFCDLTDTLVGAKNNTHRMRAAEILELLCDNYTDDDNYLKSLKEAVLNAMPEVLTEILGCRSKQATTQAETEANLPRYSAVDADLEEGPALPDNEQRNIYSSHKQNGEKHGDRKLPEALLSLCATVCQKWISTGPDLGRRFDEIASKICSEQGKPVMAFTLLVKEAREILIKKNA
ncbi:unnamed protein product [Urochloa humidicola]